MTTEKRYDQIFYIRGSVGRFAACYEAKGYLPALELPDEEAPIVPVSNKYVLERLDKVLAEARYRYNATTELLKPHLDKKKKYIDYKDDVT